MDLTHALCKYSADENVKVGFIGGAPETLESMQAELTRLYPTINISYVFSPPFRELSDSEKQDIITDIRQSEINILFVGLGCPKQERWMAENKHQLNCVMLGVGAAFDFIAGNKKHAPQIMQKLGLEWLFRLLSEPKRLWKRYLSTNPKFVALFLLQMLGKKF